MKKARGIGQSRTVCILPVLLKQKGHAVTGKPFAIFGIRTVDRMCLACPQRLGSLVYVLSLDP